MALVPGMRVMLCYDLPGPELFHERWVLGVCLCGRGWVVVMTPDGDVFSEQVALENEDLRSFRLVMAGHDLPYGIAAASCYRFAALP